MRLRLLMVACPRRQHAAAPRDQSAWKTRLEVEERQGGRGLRPVVPVRPAVAQQPHLGQLRDLLRLSLLLRVCAMGRPSFVAAGGQLACMTLWAARALGCGREAVMAVRWLMALMGGSSAVEHTQVVQGRCSAAVPSTRVEPGKAILPVLQA